MQNCIINKTKYGGGILIDKQSRGKFIKSTFLNMTATNGAAIAAYMNKIDWETYNREHNITANNNNKRRIL